MKTMTCKQLGGACDLQFHAETFEEMAEQSKNHGMAMREDAAHLKAMQAMMELMKDTQAMKTWFDGKRKEFDALPDDQ